MVYTDETLKEVKEIYNWFVENTGVINGESAAMLTLSYFIVKVIGD